MSIVDFFGNRQDTSRSGRGAPIARPVLALLGAGALLAACGTDDSAGTGTSDDSGGGSSAVGSQTHPDLGTILVDSNGNTIYFSDQETDGEVRCVAECLQFWAPVTAASDSTPTSTDIADLGVIRRQDNNQNQLSYQGKPLYTFTMDKAAGDTSGDNVEDAFSGTTFTWHAVVLAGNGQAPQQPDPGGGY